MDELLLSVPVIKWLSKKKSGDGKTFESYLSKNHFDLILINSKTNEDLCYRMTMT